MIDNFKIEKMIIEALKEDKDTYDVTSEWLFQADDISSANLIAKEDGILSGIEVFESVFHLIDPKICIEKLANDGDQILIGQYIAKIKGSTKHILYGERTALNLLQRMSGIATMTWACVNEISHSKAKIVDTRKTAPGLRIIDKMAVRSGGGFNHRFNLSDGVLIKDNHIMACGSITEAINRTRMNAPHTLKIEIEVESVEDFKEAIAANADIIMLDNMSIEDMRECVKLNNGKCLLEASGNMTLERLKSVADTGVDIISIGSLTHSVKALDISLRFD